MCNGRCILNGPAPSERNGIEFVFYVLVRLGNTPHQTQPAILCHIGQQHQMNFERAGPIRTQWCRIRIFTSGCDWETSLSKASQPSCVTSSKSTRCILNGPAPSECHGVEFKFLTLGVIGKRASANQASHSVSHRSTTANVF